jgi:hypothetical protein
MSLLAKRMPALLVGLSLTLTLIVGVGYVLLTNRDDERGSSGRATPLSESPLLIENVALVEHSRDDSVAVIQYDLGWAEDEFPGIYNCTWEVLDANGSVVGEYTTPVVVLEKLSTDLTKEIPITGAPASARATCETERLDTGTYQYDISSVSVSQSEGGGVLIRFTAQWLGDGVPGVVRCDGDVLANAGEVLESEQVNFASGVSRSDDNLVRIDIPSESAGRASGAELDCTPYT